MAAIKSILLIYVLFNSLNPVRAETVTDDKIVDLQLRWHHQFQFAGYYAALEKGYYQQEGLDVRLHEGDPGHQPVSEVLAGHAAYAEGNSEVLYHYLLGKPLVALAAIFQHSPSVILVRQDSGIQSVHDLIGKKIMLMNITEDADFLTMFLNEGISLAKLTILPSSYHLDDLVYAKVDGFNSYLTNEPYYLQQHNIPYRVIAPSNYRIDFYSDILFTTVSELRQHPKRVEAMRRATLKGWVYAFAHPDEIIDILINHYHVNKTREHLQFEAAEMRKLVFPDLIEMGHMNPDRWQHMADTFIKVGLTKPDYSLTDFIYDTTPKRIPDWLILVMVGVLFILGGVSFISIYLHRLNRHLTKTKIELLIHKDQLNEAQHLAHLGSWEWEIISDALQWSDVAAMIYTPDDVQVKPSFDVFKQAIHPDDLDKVMATITLALAEKTPYDFEHRVISKSKGERYVHARGKVLTNIDGKVLRLFGTIQDITEQKTYENKLINALASADRFSHALDHIAAYIYMKDKHHRYVYANQPALEFFKCSFEAIIGCDDSQFFPADIVDKIYGIEAKILLHGESSMREIEIKSPEGDIRYYWEVKAPIYDPVNQSQIWGICGISYDITDRKFLEEELKRQAHIDYLTEVSNRRYFMGQAEQELNRAIRYHKTLCFFVLDIDFFKQINDNHGHQIGDIVIKKLTEICRLTLRDVDIIGRLGGEEFAIILPETPLAAGINVAERLRVAIAESQTVTEAGLIIQFTVSIGVVSLGSKDDTIDTLLNLADQALYQAKNTGRNKICVGNQ